jgi:hypothetical protein
MVCYFMSTRRPAVDANTTGARSAARITPADVDRAADALLREGARPTIEKVRAKIGRGSPNTINPLLDQWWSRLAGRLDAGPAALHRLPEPVLHAAEGLWLHCLDEARRRAQMESGSSRKALARERQELDVQSHVLAIREQELKDGLAKADRRIAALELELETLTTLLRKEQASRLHAERRARDAEARPEPSKRSRPRARAAGPRTPTLGAKNSRKRTSKPARSTAPARRRVTTTRSRRR